MGKKKVKSLKLYNALISRVFGTMDADPDMAKELILQAQGISSFKDKVFDYLRNIPFFGSIVPTPPEKEDY